MGTKGRGHSVARMFEERVAQSADATAFIENGVRFSYRDLNARAAAVAAALRRSGLQSGGTVPVIVDVSVASVVGVLGVLKAGGAYVPIDVGTPPARRLDLRADVPSDLAVVPHPGLLDAAYPRAITVSECDVRAADAGALECATGSCAEDPTPNDVACIMYTSGTTERPRGVIVTSTMLASHIGWMADTYPFAADDTALIYRPCSVIASAWDHLGPLLSGIPSVVVPSSGRVNPREILETAIDHGVTHLSGVPSFWQAILDQPARLLDGWRTLRLGVTSGEQMPVRLARSWKRAFPRARLLNLYSSTECFRSCAYEIDDIPAGTTRIPIGKPTPYATVRVLDKRLVTVTHGTVGQICVAGPCVANGYLNDPELTATRFLDGAAAAAMSGQRMFTTGDLGRWREDGELEFVGRVDDQIKLLGYRFGVAEIETALLQHGRVRQAAIVCAGTGVRRHLVAFVVPFAHDAIDANDLRAHLGARLPAHMIPGSYVPLDALPLARSSKVDRGRLRRLLKQPKPPATRRRGRSIEQRVVAIAASVLGRPEAGLASNFLELGGHSLIAMQIAARLNEEFGVDVLLDQFFSPTFTLGDLATAVRHVSAR